MKKSTKGALAASSAAVLLLGGAGSLAFWSDSQDVGSANITSGELTLGAPDCSDDLVSTVPTAGSSTAAPPSSRARPSSSPATP